MAEMDSEDGVLIVRKHPNGDIYCVASNSTMETTEELLGNIDSYTEPKELDTPLLFSIDDISITDISRENLQQAESTVENHEFTFSVDVQDAGIEMSLPQTSKQNDDMDDGVTSSAILDTEVDAEELPNTDTSSALVANEVKQKRKKKAPKKFVKDEESATPKVKFIKKTNGAAPLKEKETQRKKSMTVVTGDESAYLFDKPIPEGWSRKAVQRKHGASAGKYDVYIYSPSGQKFRSRREVAVYLEQTCNKSYDLDSFQFTVGKAGVKQSVQNNLPAVSSKGTKTDIQTDQIIKKEKSDLTVASTSSTNKIPKVSKSSFGKHGKTDHPRKIKIKKRIDYAVASTSSTNNFPQASTSSEKTGKESKRKIKRINIHSTTESSSSKINLLQSSASTQGKPEEKICTTDEISTENENNTPIDSTSSPIPPPKDLASGADKILDKLIPSLSNDKTCISSSLFDFHVIKRKNKVNDKEKSFKKFKSDSNTKTNNDNFNSASTSKVGIYPKKLSTFTKQKKKLGLFKKKSSMNGPPKRPLLKKTTPSIKPTHRESVVTKKGRGRPRKNGHADFTVLELSKEKELIKDIPNKNLLVSLVKCDSDNASSTESNDRVEVPVKKTDSIASNGVNGCLGIEKIEIPKNGLLSTNNLTLPKSPYNLIYEQLYTESWKLLVATIIIRNSSAPVGTTLVWKFLEKYPTLEALKEATLEDLEKALNVIDLPQKCAKKMSSFAKEVDSKAWLYPIEITGIGKYGNDAYKIFCMNEWRDVKPDEYDLCVYHNWLSQNHVKLHM